VAVTINAAGAVTASGAITAAAGSFTTVNASGDYTQSASGGRLTFSTVTGNGGVQNNNGTSYVLNYGASHATKASHLDLSSTSAINLQSAGTTVATISSTGLAVTGSISSTTGATFATSSGNVGIGTTSPQSGLHVFKNDDVVGGSITFGHSGSNDGNWAYGYTGEEDALTYNVYGRGNRTLLITPFTILNSGKVGIGTASPGYQLTLSTDSAAKPSTNTWTISSDERIKDNISLANLERCYEIVKSLPLKRYTWKADAYTVEQVADRGKLGWIAQDVQKVFPKSTPISKFYGVPEDDGFEDVQEQVTLDEERTTESTAIEVVNGIPTQKTTSKTETTKVPQFDDVVVVDEAGEPVMVPQTDKEIAVVDDAGEPVLDDDGKPMMETVKVANKPLMHQVPRMHTVSKAKMKTEEIEDCLSLNSDQIYAAMYGTIQQLIINSELQQAIIESLTTRLTALEGGA